MTEGENFFKESREKERGKNVEIIISVIRHGQKDKEGKLSDFGREEAVLVRGEKELAKDGIKHYVSTLRRAIQVKF